MWSPGNNPSRIDLDAALLNHNSVFWKDVTDAFVDGLHFGVLIVDCPELEGIDPTIAVKHSAVKLHNMWKEVNNKCIQALSKYTQSGTHKMDFWIFSGGRAEVLYLREWLNVKPLLTSFVKGGWFDGDGYSSCFGEDIVAVVAVEPTPRGHGSVP